MMELTKGDICLVNFNPSKGGEIGKLRPAIIMSSKEEISMLATVIVIPLSTVIEDDALPYRYPIIKRDKLEQKSDACIYEIRALSKIRIKEKIGSVTDDELATVKKALCEILG
ncbi:MAG: type II toxin-antitoxin system PemK/MazF family toxin [Epsilonproteobacteria bacterium]|nr:MAG: type II toxin-antitoxin system PemK/MazF family toxin [Campylobacterota bacterium]